ncbi:hypothetical protein E2542_SST01199 [Spatholobus suberectus]|nr:hypothetical protein E2542_SST01199 [Spatholobus suberectus]
MKMSTIQVAAIRPGIYAQNVSQLRRSFHSGPRTLPMRFDPLSVTSLSLRAEHSSRLQCQTVLKSRQSLHVCFAGGQGMMENSGDFQSKSLQEAMGQLKGQSIEDILQEQIQKGGSGGKPPGGRGGGGGGGSSGGSDGMSDETLQVVLATVSFILMYIFVISGLELMKLARDCIKFLSGRGQSVRLKRAIYKWVRVYKNIIEKKEAVKNGLENASKCWFDPDFYRGVLRRHYVKSHPEA